MAGVGTCRWRSTGQLAVWSHLSQQKSGCAARCVKYYCCCSRQVVVELSGHDFCIISIIILTQQQPPEHQQHQQRHQQQHQQQAVVCGSILHAGFPVPQHTLSVVDASHGSVLYCASPHDSPFSGERQQDRFGRSLLSVHFSGGDGTILFLSNMFDNAVPPIVSFHMGSLGMYFAVCVCVCVHMKAPVCCNATLPLQSPNILQALTLQMACALSDKNMGK